MEEELLGFDWLTQRGSFDNIQNVLPIIRCAISKEKFQQIQDLLESGKYELKFLCAEACDEKYIETPSAGMEFICPYMDSNVYLKKLYHF